MEHSALPFAHECAEARILSQSVSLLIEHGFHVFPISQKVGVAFNEAVDFLPRVFHKMIWEYWTVCQRIFSDQDKDADVETVFLYF